MAKKHKMKRDDVERITGKRTYFEETICLHDGLIVKEENGKFSTDETDDLGPNDIITIRFNKEVYERIAKYMRTLLTMRGVKDIGSIDARDPDVMDLLRKWKKRTGRRALKGSEERRLVNQFIETVTSVHRPEYMRAFFQVIIWAIVYDDFFTVSSGSIEYRIDVEVKEEYWENNQTSQSDLDAMLSDYQAPALVYDRTNPLEVMLSVVSSLVDEYEEFSEALVPYYQRIAVAMQVMGNARRFDDAGFLNERLDELLSDALDETDDVGEQEHATRSSGSDGKTSGTKRRKPVGKTSKQADEGDQGEIIRPHED